MVVVYKLNASKLQNLSEKQLLFENYLQQKYATSKKIYVTLDDF